MRNPREDGSGNLDWEGRDPEGDAAVKSSPQPDPVELSVDLNTQEDASVSANQDAKDFRRGGLNDEAKRRFNAVFNQDKLEALFSGLSDSARVSYPSSWLTWGAILFRPWNFYFG